MWLFAFDEYRSFSLWGGYFCDLQQTSAMVTLVRRWLVTLVLVHLAGFPTAFHLGQPNVGTALNHFQVRKQLAASESALLLRNYRAKPPSSRMRMIGRDDYGFSLDDFLCQRAVQTQLHYYAEFHDG